MSILLKTNLSVALLVASCSDTKFSGANAVVPKPSEVKAENQVVDPKPEVVPEAEIKAGDNVLNAIDSICVESNPNQSTNDIQIAPMTPGLPKTVPDNCRAGVEFNSLLSTSFELSASSPITAHSHLEIDYATYAAPDAITLSAISPAGEKVFLKTCRLKSWDKGDPTAATGSNTRPVEDSIRGFRTMIPAGTTSIKFDFTGVKTPTYLRIVGLCQFNTTPEKVTIVDPKRKMVTLRPVN